MTLEYADGKSEECIVNGPDWTMKFDYQSQDDGLLPANIAHHGIDRGPTRNAAYADNNALFDTMFPVDSSRELTAITVPPKPNRVRVSNDARFNLLAITRVIAR